MVEDGSADPAHNMFATSVCLQQLNNGYEAELTTAEPTVATCSSTLSVLDTMLPHAASGSMPTPPTGARYIYTYIYCMYV